MYIPALAVAVPLSWMCCTNDGILRWKTCWSSCQAEQVWGFWENPVIPEESHEGRASVGASGIVFLEEEPHETPGRASWSTWKIWQCRWALGTGESTEPLKYLRASSGMQMPSGSAALGVCVCSAFLLLLIQTKHGSAGVTGLGAGWNKITSVQGMGPECPRRRGPTGRG